MVLLTVTAADAGGASISTMLNVKKTTTSLYLSVFILIVCSSDTYSALMGYKLYAYALLVGWRFG